MLGYVLTSNLYHEAIQLNATHFKVYNLLVPACKICEELQWTDNKVIYMSHEAAALNFMRY